MNVAIVVVAYNRPQALVRLLSSVACASYEGFDKVPLIISIDGGGNPEVVKVAQQFQWQFGEKKVFSHKTNLGLKAHVLSAGDRVADHDGIIMIEEDLLVSPLFYKYSCEALEKYKDTIIVGGISLYRYHHIHQLPFHPVMAYGNVFLIRFPSSWGQAWTKSQWEQFRFWLKSEKEEKMVVLDANLPRSVGRWPSGSSWKKEFARYLLDANKYIVYPGMSLTTNMGDAGYHWQWDTLVNQVPMQYSPLKFQFVEFSKMVSYDQFFELEPRSLPIMGNQDETLSEVEFDLYGQKPFNMIRDKLTVSSKKPHSKYHSFGLDLLPHELNIMYKIPGNEFHLAEGAEFVNSSPLPRLTLMKHQTAHYGGRDLLKLFGQKLLAKVKT